MKEADFRAEGEELMKWVAWMKMEGASMIKRFQEMDSKGKMPAIFENNRVPRGDTHGYQSVAVFLLPQTPGEEPALGGMAFDAEYLRDRFFPEMLTDQIKRNLAETRSDQ